MLPACAALRCAALRLPAVGDDSETVRGELLALERAVQGLGLEHAIQVRGGCRG